MTITIKDKSDCDPRNRRKEIIRSLTPSKARTYQPVDLVYILSKSNLHQNTVVVQMDILYHVIMVYFSQNFFVLLLSNLNLSLPPMLQQEGGLICPHSFFLISSPSFFLLFLFNPSLFLSPNYGGSFFVHVGS